MDKLEILDEIERLVRPLDPPVRQFEHSIRRTPFRILISVLLSSRTKDPVTRQASENLFSRAPTPADMAELPEGEIAELIFPVGFYKQKARRVKRIAETLKGKNGIPETYEELVALPGVGRKTANLVLSLAFDIPAIAVDIHVFRISQRLGWAAGKTPEEIEDQLREGFPREQWNRINQVLVGFGQTLCRPRDPLCGRCTLTHHCPYFLNRGKKGGSG